MVIIIYFYFYFFILTWERLFHCFSREKRLRGWDREQHWCKTEASIGPLPYVPGPGIMCLDWGVTCACSQTGNQTHNLLVPGRCSNKMSHAGQSCDHYMWTNIFVFAKKSVTINLNLFLYCKKKSFYKIYLLNHMMSCKWIFGFWDPFFTLPCLFHFSFGAFCALVLLQG